jgi:hypothetical protein
LFKIAIQGVTFSFNFDQLIVILGFECRAFCLLSMHSTTELNLCPFCFIFCLDWVSHLCRVASWDGGWMPPHPAYQLR